MTEETQEYNHSEIESKWQKKWKESKVFEVKESDNKEKYYCLEMFPYPSGEGLHIGHALNYVIGDILARYKRMNNYNVLYPMGYDAFGLPAENAAIKAGEHPKSYTEKAIKNFIEQQKAIGLSYDWSKLLSSCYPEYYKWNQYFFLKFLEKGLAYRKRAPVNWCPECQTVLANEQAQGGKCWRHEDTDVEIKHLEQWFIKTTAYTEELLNEIDNLEWPERIKAMQRNWIGKSEGSEIIFEVETPAHEGCTREPKKTKSPIFTTRPDTLFGVTFMVVSAQHPKLMEIVTSDKEKEINNFLKKINSVSQEEIEQLEKEGVFTGSYAINPINNEKIPVYAGNFVLAEYGSGMVMAVPAHDQRDFDFAKKYKIDIKEVVKPNDEGVKGVSDKKAYTGQGKLINSGSFNELDNEEAKNKITEFLSKKGLAKKTIEYKFRDWLVSRQRYWGTPIPVIYCDNCKKNIEENSFELNFYNEEVFEQIAKGLKTIETRALNPQEKERFFGDVKKGDTIKGVNKNNGEQLFLEIIDSWKYKNLNYLFKDKASLEKIFPGKEIIDIKKLESLYSFTEDYPDRIKKNGLIAWKIKLVKPGIVPVNENELPIILPDKVKFGEGNPLKTNSDFVNTKCPKCNSNAKRETDTMDTFVDSSWYFLRFFDNHNKEKPFEKSKSDYWMPVNQYIGGAEHACLHLIYSRFWTKALRDLGMVSIDEPFKKLFNQGMLHASDGKKMSKSLGNVINPLDIIKNKGADALRFTLMSFASPDSDTNWDEKVLEGTNKFLNKVYNKISNIKIIKKSSPRTESKLNKTIKQVTEDFDTFRNNLALIKIRAFFNSIKEEESKEVIESFLKLLHPVCPHITEELWEKIGNKDFISIEEWPKADESKIDEKYEKQEQAIEKIIEDINNIKKIIFEKEKKETKKGIIYVLPNEKEIYLESLEEIKKRTATDIEVFKVNEPEVKSGEKDPEEKSKKVKPGKPGIYLN